MFRNLLRYQPVKYIRQFSSSYVVYDRKLLTLFGKEGCGLCDKAKQVMLDIRDSEETPNTMEFQYVDISDVMNTQWWDKYCFDVPVLHIDNLDSGERLKMMHRLDPLKVMEVVQK
jgi:glutaredoxin